MKPLGVRLNQHLTRNLPRLTATRTHTSHTQTFQIMAMRLTDPINETSLCHSCSDLHLNTENGKTHDLGTNHDYDKTSNLGHIFTNKSKHAKTNRAHHHQPDSLKQITPESTLGTTHNFSNHTSPLQNFQSCHSCVAQIVFLSLSDNSTRVGPLLDTVAIETTPNNWNRNNQPTLQSNQKQLYCETEGTRPLAEVGIYFSHNKNAQNDWCPSSQITHEFECTPSTDNSNYT